MGHHNSKDAVHIVGCSGCGGDSVKSRVEDTLEDDLRPGILWNTTASRDRQGILFSRQECYLISGGEAIHGRYSLCWRLHCVVHHDPPGSSKEVEVTQYCLILGDNGGAATCPGLGMLEEGGRKDVSRPL